jgi:UDP-N-acetylglucosamine 2-epimerase (non-hydrolysing)
VPLVRQVLDGGITRPAEGPPLWDGHAGERIGGIVRAWLAARR